MNWTQRRRRRARRRFLVRVGAAGVGVLACLSVVGLFLESEQVMSGRVRLGRPPEAVWRVLLDLDGMPLWRSDLVALERLPDQQGRPAWREIGRGETRVIELTAIEPPLRLVQSRTRAGIPGYPARTFELAATAEGTLVTLSERMLVRNPMRRALYRLHPPRAAITRLLRDLAGRLGGELREVAATRAGDLEHQPRRR